MQKEKSINKRKQTKNDILLVIAICVIVAIAFAVYLATRTQGSVVTVQIGESVHSSYPLDTDITVTLPSGDDGKQFNVLVISDGKASVLEASCPDLVCAHHKPIQNTGETIVCLPNKVIITVE